MDRAYKDLDDRDLLLLLNAKVDGVQITATELKLSIGLKADIKHVEKLESYLEKFDSCLDEKADKKEIEKIEAKLISLEKAQAATMKWIYMASGAMILLKFAADFFKH